MTAFLSHYAAVAEETVEDFDQGIIVYARFEESTKAVEKIAGMSVLRSFTDVCEAILGHT
jgi:hypothetical protein